MSRHLMTITINMEKSSKYNIYLLYKDRFYVYNQLSSDLREVDKELFEMLQSNQIDRSVIDDDTKIDLKEANLICDDKCVEENFILCANKQYRFSNNTARVTVMPTLECNFRCWYCYESHDNGCMSKENVDSVIAFCKDLIDARGTKHFILDWFGGEPLLYFNEVVYPISMAIKDYCQEKEVSFSNSITTNGFLVDKDMVEKLKEINLASYQITLDGARDHHNKTRFLRGGIGSYDKIVENITLLCRNMEVIAMTVRINYTPQNLSSIDAIAKAFPEDVRSKIFIEPQLVWQFKADINGITDEIAEKMKAFHEAGYRTLGTTLPAKCAWCYAENMNQYVINFDMNVYKCTARDFKNTASSIGTISSDGSFKPNDNYYKYYTSSYFENDTCLACSLLPSCTGMCIQKKVEGGLPSCPKESVMENITNCLKAFIDLSEKD